MLTASYKGSLPLMAVSVRKCHDGGYFVTFSDSEDFAQISLSNECECGTFESKVSQVARR